MAKTELSCDCCHDGLLKFVHTFELHISINFIGLFHIVCFSGNWHQMQTRDAHSQYHCWRWSWSFRVQNLGWWKYIFKSYVSKTILVQKIHKQIKWKNIPIGNKNQWPLKTCLMVVASVNVLQNKSDVSIRQSLSFQHKRRFSSLCEKTTIFVHAPLPEQNQWSVKTSLYRKNTKSIFILFLFQSDFSHLFSSPCPHALGS